MNVNPECENCHDRGFFEGCCKECGTPCGECERYYLEELLWSLLVA